MLIKKLYLILFRFINGKNERDFFRFWAHCFTIVTFVIAIIFPMNFIDYLMGEVVSQEGVIFGVVAIPFALVVFPCLGKLAILLWSMESIQVDCQKRQINPFLRGSKVIFINLYVTTAFPTLLRVLCVGFARKSLTVPCVTMGAD